MVVFSAKQSRLKDIFRFVEKIA